VAAPLLCTPVFNFRRNSTSNGQGAPVVQYHYGHAGLSNSLNCTNSVQNVSGCRSERIAGRMAVSINCPRCNGSVRVIRKIPRRSVDIRRHECRNIRCRARFNSVARIEPLSIKMPPPTTMIQVDDVATDATEG
jgi:hypothetical protein